MAKVHSSLATTELHNPKGIGVESATEELLTMSASLGAVSASASMVPHTADVFNLGSDSQRWNNITAKGNISSSATSTGSFGRLELAGNAEMDGTLTIAGGTTTLGDSDSDTVVITADLASNLIPDADGTRDIGSTAASWKNIHADGTGSFKNIITSHRLYLHDGGGEYIDGDGTDLNFYSSADINIPANVGLTFGNDGEKIEGDGTDLTISGNNINLTGTADVKIPANVGIMFGTHEKIESDDTDLNISVGANGDINIPTDIGLTFGDDGEKIEGDGTDLTIASSAKLNLTATSDVHIPQNVGLVFDANGSEKIESNDTDLTINAGADINLTAVGDVNIPSGVGVTFGNDGEKIEGDGTDLTISGNIINLSPTADVVLPNDKGIQFGGASEKIEGDGTDLTISANNLNIDAAADLVINVDGGDVTFHDDTAHLANISISKISGSATSTGSFAEGRIINKLGINESAPAEALEVGGNVSGSGTGSFHHSLIRQRSYLFDAGGEYFSGDGTDLTIASGQDINLTATTDINIPANVGLTFGNDGEKIEGDGTDLTIAGNNINLTGTADIKVPANVGIMFGTHEKIESDDTDLTITVGSGGDINIPADIGLTFGDDGEKIEGDGTDLTISGAKINLSAGSDVHIPKNKGIVFDDNGSEKIESNDTDLTINSGADINLTATTDINIPSDVGLTFGDDGEKIEGDGTDMTIASSGVLTLSSGGNTVIETVTLNNGNVTIPGDLTVTGNRLEAQVGSLQVADHTITVGSGSATSALMHNGGIDWGISGSVAFLRYRHAGTAISSSVFLEAPKLTVDTITLDAAEIDASGALTIDTGGDLTLDATGDVNVPANIGMTFGNDGEKIEGDGTDLTIASSNDLNLTATTDINIPADVGLTFGNDGEKIEGDGTDLTISANIIKLNSTVTSGSSTSTGSFGRTSTSTLDLDSIQGNWTNAGNTIADLGTVTTADINGGTVDGITSLTAGGNLDIGAHTFRANRLIADHATAERVAYFLGDGELEFDDDFRFDGETLKLDKMEALNDGSYIRNFWQISGSATSTGSFGAVIMSEVIGNWTNAGNTIADLGSVTTCDINGGTINGITDLAVADGGTGQSTLNNLITMGTHTTGDYVESLGSGALIDLTNNSGEGATPTIDVDLTEAGEAAIANGDYILFLDGGATGTHAKEAIADVATLFAGDGLQASNSVMAVDVSDFAGDGLRDAGSENLAVDVSDFAGTGLEDDGSENLRLASQGTGIAGGGGSTLSVAAAQTSITSIYNTSLKLGSASDDEWIDFGTDAMIKFGIDDAEDFRMADGGTFHANADVVAYSSTISSDEKLKTNIEDTKYGLDDVLKLRGVDFNWKEKFEGKKDVGFIAQEVQEVLPELVKEVDSIGEDDGDTHLTVDYAKVAAILAEAVKELNQKIEHIEKNCECLNK